MLTPAAFWTFSASWLNLPGDAAVPNLGGLSWAGFPMEAALEQVVVDLEQVVAGLAQAEVDA